MIGFVVVVLGAQGGLVDGDLSAYLATRADKPEAKAVLLDAGTLVHGIEVAKAKHALDGDVAGILRDRVGPVLLSHAHFDHLTGLIIASPDDPPRTIYGLPSTIDALRDHVFNGVTWANFADEGAPPALKKYHYARMEPGRTAHVDDAAVDVTAFPLAHGPITSTAFLVDAGAAAIVYCGDTGPDAVEKSDRLAKLFERIAPLVRDHKLAAIFIEASYPSARDDKALFGHLTPKHVVAELHALAHDVDPAHEATALAGLNVVVTHVKPALTGAAPRDIVAAELQRMNDLGVRFVVPAQGDVLSLSPPQR